jgi:5-methylcytosine-specific restriction endonuclease McrA
MDLRELSDEALLSDVTKLVGSHRELTAKLVAHLAEIEERRLHLLAGFSSMFDFCTKALHLGEGEAFRRILAARLGRRFPVVYARLASGSLNLSTLELLREWLTDDNHEELFVAVANKSKREVQAFLASRFPRPDKPSKIRPATIAPLSEARFAIEFTASDALREKLELCRDLVSHANPSRDLAVVIERAVDLLLAELQRKRLARTKRRQTAQNLGEGKPSRISNAIRRAVFERDGLQCTYVAKDGRRCDARALLELDHIEPRAFGGSNDEKNLRVRCRAHNQLWAEQAFGREQVERSRHFCQKKRATEPPIAMPFAKLQSALRGMGFRESEARKAVATVVGRHAPSDFLTLEQALREAVLVATAA